MAVILNFRLIQKQNLFMETFTEHSNEVLFQMVKCFQRWIFLRYFPCPVISNMQTNILQWWPSQNTSPNEVPTVWAILDFQSTMIYKLCNAQSKNWHLFLFCSEFQIGKKIKIIMRSPTKYSRHICCHLSWQHHLVFSNKWDK